MIEEGNDPSSKLQNHLKLLKNEYSKLQKSYAELERKLDDLQTKSSNETSGDNSSFNSRLVMVVTSLYGRKTYSDLMIKLKDKQIPAHKFVLNARSEEWREEVLSDVTELDWSDLDVNAGYALLRWIYTDIVDLQQQDSLSLSLLKAAHKFKLNSLMGLCERALVASVNVRSCVAFYCVAEEVGASNLLEYCSSIISSYWDELLPQDFVHMSGALLFKMLKSKTKFPLHAAIRLRREDVVFLCLVENEGTDIVNSLSTQGHLPLRQALIEQHTGIANLLVQNGNADVNAKNADGSTLLIDSIKRGDGFSARFLLDHDCDVNLVTDGSEDTVLHIICTYAKESTEPEVYKEMIEIGQLILSKSCDINKQNSKGFTALHLAITCGHLDMIEELLKIPETDLNLMTSDGKSALLLALLSPQFTDFSVAKQIIDNGAEANELYENGDNILQFLIKSSREAAAIFMCDHANLNYKNHDNLTVLHLAAKFGHAELVKRILSCGASPNIQTGLEQMKTALHFAIEANSEDVVEAFVDFKGDEGDEKPDFNIRCAEGDTPLSLALSLKHNDLVPLLIRGGSDVNARNGEMTLLHQAIIKESPETAIFLLEQGADINALTGDQESPLQLAIHCRLESVVDALCSRGVALSAPNNKGDCPLWSALESEQENIASVLVKHGVDPDCWSSGPDGCLQTLLHRAIDEHNEYTAMFLIRSGCDLDSPRQPAEGSDFSSKESPLHLCCSYGLAKVAQALIEHGGNVNMINHENKTSLHVAIQNQHESIITMLLKHPNIDLKIRDRQGNTPFATALSVRNHKAAEKILERMPTAADQYDSRGRNFLHLAVMKDDLESVLFLISIQVDVNSRVHDVNQATPLMLSAASENEMLIRNLILAGARLNDRDSMQKTALHIAAERGRLCAVQALIQQNGCDYDAVDAEGNNALHIAMRECMMPIVKELLTESRINAEVVNIKGRNPLHELSRCGRESLAASICELFIECMPNYPLNHPDLMGNTPLLLAYMRGETQLCRVLVKSGACLGAENKDGVSIFNYKLATNQLLYRLLDELSVESPWSSSEFCQECATKFSLTMRKHHCRHCGRQICSQCSNNDVPIIKFGINKPVRVCKVCFDVLQVGSH